MRSLVGGWTIPRQWPGARVFILAGGSSLPVSQLHRLKGRMIAVKHAALVRPDAEVLFWAGRRFHREEPAVVCAHRGALLVKRTVDPEVPAWIRQVPRLKSGGLSEDPARLGGLCAGGSAINLASLLGAREIILLGFDFDGRHWLASHPLVEAPEEHHQRHMAAICEMAPALANAGVRVVNCSARSRLPCFPKGDLDAFA